MQTQSAPDRQGPPRRKGTGEAPWKWARTGMSASGLLGWELPGPLSPGTGGAQCLAPIPGLTLTRMRSTAPAATARTSARTHGPCDPLAAPRIQAHLANQAPVPRACTPDPQPSYTAEAWGADASTTMRTLGTQGPSSPTLDT